MTLRPSVSRRIAAALLGVERPGRSVEDIAARRDLPFGRRLLAAVLGVRVTARVRQEAASARTPARIRASSPAAARMAGTAVVSPAEAGGGAAARNEPGLLEADGTAVETSSSSSSTAENPPEPIAGSGRAGTAGVADDAATRVGPAPDEHQGFAAAYRAVSRTAPPRRPGDEWYGDDEPEERPARPPLETPRMFLSGGGGSAPQHLGATDREDYERILDEALRSVPHRPGLAPGRQRLNPEQLRTMALNASALITAAAATEYQYYVRVREEARSPARSSPSSAAASSPPERGVGDRGSDDETAGAGVVAVAAVLTPVLAGAAAAIFLLVGFVLRMVGGASSVADSLITTGWVFGAVTAAAVVVGAVGLLRSALRNASPRATDPYGELTDEVARAREAWHEALLDRGILPFLLDALVDHGSASASRSAASPEPFGRFPYPGHDRPGHPGTGDGLNPRRPSFASPDYTSPDYTSPDYAGPHIPSPDPAGAADSERRTESD